MKNKNNDKQYNKIINIRENNAKINVINTQIEKISKYNKLINDCKDLTKD